MTRRRLVLLTGATGGLGRAVVAGLAPLYDLALLYREESAFNELRKQYGTAVSGVRTDLSNDDSVGAAIGALVEERELGGVVLMAGGFAAGTIEATSLESLRRLLETNLITAFGVLRHSMPHIRRSGGRIVMVSSDAARHRDASIAAYTVSKSALNTLAELAAAELRGSGAGVSVLMPTAMATPEMIASGSAQALIPLSAVVETILAQLSVDAGNVRSTTIMLTAE